MVPSGSPLFRGGCCIPSEGFETSANRTAPPSFETTASLGFHSGARTWTFLRVQGLPVYRRAISCTSVVTASLEMLLLAPNVSLFSSFAVLFEWAKRCRANCGAKLVLHLGNILDPPWNGDIVVEGTGPETAWIHRRAYCQFIIRPYRRVCACGVSISHRKRLPNSLF